MKIIVPHPTRSPIAHWGASWQWTAALALGLFGLPGQFENAWARIAQVFPQRTWIHSITRSHGGVSESWMSPMLGIVTIQGQRLPGKPAVEFHDLKTDAHFTYIPEDNTIYHLPEVWVTRDVWLGDFRFWQELMAGEIPKTLHIPGTEVLNGRTQFDDFRGVVREKLTVKRI